MSTSATAARDHRGERTAFAIPIGGGTATYAGPGSPFNKIAGLGFDGTPDDAALTEVERAFAERGAPVQVELSTLADPEIGARLTARGYHLVSFENVLGRELTGGLDGAATPGIEVERSSDAEFEAWLDIVVDAFAHPDTEGVPSHEEFPRQAIADAMRDVAAAGVVRYLARRDGVVAGGASARAAGGIAQLNGAATTPAHRRRGVQTALLSARLADLAAAGCDVAVVTTQPGSRSQRNVQRHGFDLLYTRAVLTHEP
ncbi:GNAT family N-acetyltransferase [Pseudonocardia sp. S2-4]|uniref:GNAT family N-acetyltransferase n=2 Tax=Pseudonocardia humida TaxID=2800819 RepID=A0ABT1ACR9_9PSEU|nr:GNAT family N-acetyltransferase [Pseudonocardia humida]